MKNFIPLTLLLITLTGCTTLDETYFKTHPKALQKAILACPQKAPALVSCQTLHHIGVEINELVYELRMSPQEFGKKILALQAAITTPSYDEKKRLQTQEELDERIAIVGWLESPEGTT